MAVWQEYPAKAVNWACFIEGMSLSEGKKFFGGRCVLGGFDNRPQGVLYSGTREEVISETKRILADSGRTGVILGADCTLPATVDPVRFGWVVDAAQAAL